MEERQGKVPGLGCVRMYVHVHTSDDKRRC